MEEFLPFPGDQFMDFCIPVEGATKRIRTNKPPSSLDKWSFNSVPPSLSPSDLRWTTLRYPPVAVS